MSIVKNSENEVRIIWKLILVLLVTEVISFAVNYGLYYFMDYYVYSSQGMISEFLNKSLNSPIFTIIDITVIIITDSVLIAVPVIVWKYLFKKNLSSMGLVPLRGNNKYFITGLLSGIITMSITFIILILTNNAEVVSWKPKFNIYIIFDLVLFIVVGFAEEIFVRGYVMSVLKKTRNLPLIIIVSSAIFSLSHIFNNAFSLIPFINIILVGVALALMYIYTGNLWMPIGFHISWNYFQGDIFGFPVSGNITNGIISTVYLKNNAVNGGYFGPEGGLAVTAVCIIMIIFIVLYFKKVSINFFDNEI